MAYEDCLARVIETVLARDLPEDSYGDAVAHEAELMAGIDPDHAGCTWDA